MSYNNDNRGAIWGNDKKETETQPDFKGNLTVEGKEYFVSAWKRKEGANPKAPALSFSIQPKEQQSGAYQSQGEQAKKSSDPFASAPDFGDVPDDDQIPFS